MKKKEKEYFDKVLKLPNTGFPISSYYEQKDKIVDLIEILADKGIAK